MKEYLHIFTDVKEALPPDHSDKTIINIDNVEGRAFYVHEVYWIGTREFYPPWVFTDPESDQCYLENGWYYYTQQDGENQYYPIEVLYWLDLSKLTTKEKAITYAYECSTKYDINSPHSEINTLKNVMHELKDIL